MFLDKILKKLPYLFLISELLKISRKILKNFTLIRIEN
jgi:hypothetical protein